MGFIADLLAPKNNFQYQNAPMQQTNVGQALAAALSQPSQTLQGQNSLIQALQQQMQGGGPNLGATQLQAGTDRINQQAAGLIGSQRGLDPALAARQILMQQAQNSQGASNQAAQLRQQQQLEAQQQLGNTLGQQGQLGVQQLGTLGNIQQGQNALNVQQSLGGQQLGLESQLANQRSSSSVLGGLGQGAGSLLGLGIGHAEGGLIHDMTDGGGVPGVANLPGDHPANDTVPAMLSPGEVVIPRSLVQEANPAEIKKFIDALKTEKSKPGYGKVLKAKQKLKD